MTLSGKIRIFAFTSLALILLAWNIVLISKKNAIAKEFTNARHLLENIEERLQESYTERDKITKENEKLQADATSYLAVNTKLQDEKEALNNAVAAAKVTLDAKESNLERLKQNLKALEKAIARKGPEKELKLEEESRSLRKKIASLDKKLKNERSVYYYNLGVAYTQAKYYEEAIRAYESSLKFDQNNADAHYNLAIAYDDIKDDRTKAIYHYNAYLKLRPQAPDRDEIETAISHLK